MGSRQAQKAVSSTFGCDYLCQATVGWGLACYLACGFVCSDTPNTAQAGLQGKLQTSFSLYKNSSDEGGDATMLLDGILVEALVSD